MIKAIKDPPAFGEERGAALVWVAGSLVMLLAFSALAVDLAWLYLNSSRLQNAADASALAAVVNAPGFMGLAQNDAEDAATANGFPVGGANTVMATLLNDNTVQATLTTNVPTYFLKVLGFNSFDVTRRSTAQYVKPVPMGSPSNCFGIGYSAALPAGGCGGSTQNFWAAIQGQATAKEHGDPYATRCDWSAGGNCTDSVNDGSGAPWDTNADPNNPTFRPDGYYYAVDIPTGKTSFTVQVFDAGFYDRSSFGETGDEESLFKSTGGGTDMHYELYMVDTTPLDPTDNAPIGGCSLNIGSGASAGTYRNQWRNLCTVNSPTAGIYVLRVWNSNPGIGGSNSYSLNVTANPSTGNNPRFYAINDMSIFTNAPSGNATVYLAEIDPVHAGKRLELKFYDPGEGGGNAYMTVLMPNGSIPNCTWFSEDMDGNTSSPVSGQCRIQTTVSGTAQYNKEWITTSINIPNSYTCGVDCYWKMNLDLNTSHDRTTWQARVIGNPVRLVPNP
jgi:hypothetical protein